MVAMNQAVVSVNLLNMKLEVPAACQLTSIRFWLNGMTSLTFWDYIYTSDVTSQQVKKRQKGGNLKVEEI